MNLDIMEDQQVKVDKSHTLELEKQTTSEVSTHKQLKTKLKPFSKVMYNILSKKSARQTNIKTNEIEQVLEITGNSTFCPSTRRHEPGNLGNFQIPLDQAIASIPVAE